MPLCISFILPLNEIQNSYLCSWTTPRKLTNKTLFCSHDSRTMKPFLIFTSVCIPLIMSFFIQFNTSSSHLKNNSSLLANLSCISKEKANKTSNATRKTSQQVYDVFLLAASPPGGPNNRPDAGQGASRIPPERNPLHRNSATVLTQNDRSEPLTTGNHCLLLRHRRRSSQRCDSNPNGQRVSNSPSTMESPLHLPHQRWWQNRTQSRQSTR